MHASSWLPVSLPRQTYLHILLSCTIRGLHGLKPPHCTTLHYTGLDSTTTSPDSIPTHHAALCKPPIVDSCSRAGQGRGDDLHSIQSLSTARPPLLLLTLSRPGPASKSHRQNHDYRKSACQKETRLIACPRHFAMERTLSLSSSHPSLPSQGHPDASVR